MTSAGLNNVYMSYFSSGLLPRNTENSNGISNQNTGYTSPLFTETNATDLNYNSGLDAFGLQPTFNNLQINNPYDFNGYSNIYSFNMSNLDFSQFNMNNIFTNNSNLSVAVDKLYESFTTSITANQNKINQLIGMLKPPATNINTGNQNNDDMIAKLNPQMQLKVQSLLSYAKSQGLDVTITSGFRTQAQQEELLRTRPQYAAKNSLHCQGKAIDINIANGTDEDYEKLGDYAKSIGMRWGGDFSKVKERWHFDLGHA